MKLDKHENFLGTIWFLAAGSVAICLAVFLYRVDLKITYSDAEQIKGQELREVRMAQSSLPTNVVDRRLKVQPGNK